MPRCMFAVAAAAVLVACPAIAMAQAGKGPDTSEAGRAAP